MSRRLSHLITLLCLIGQHLVLRTYATAQDYLSATGSPNFSVNIPVPNGYVNVANGNLHLEFPLASMKQRGNLQLNEKLVYDSRIWKIIHYSGYYWWPLNVPNSSLGWRFIKGNETGSVSYNIVNSYSNDCTDQYGDDNTQYEWDYAIVWTDPSGTNHTFDGYQKEYQDGCNNNNYTQQIYGGYADDASGYQVQDDGTGNPIITDPKGNQVYPSVIDRFGNYWSNDANGNLVDDLGRTPVIVSQSGSQTYYDVLAPNGPIQNNGTRVRYTVTMANVPISTEFNENPVVEYQNNGGNNPSSVPAIQSIQLPDGSSYTFGYDPYGEISTMTLPTGSTVLFGWSNYKDSYQNVNRWLESTTAGFTTYYTPSVISQCSQSGTGCQEQVDVQRPSGDETVYTLTLNNGAWNVGTTIYQGAASSGLAKATDSTSYDYSHSCTYSWVCGGAQYVTKSTDVQTLPDAGLATQTQTLYSNPESGQMTTLNKWDYYTGSPSQTSTRQSIYTYSGYDLTSETDYDQNGGMAAQTTYNYTGNAIPTSGIVGHGSVNAGGPYLSSVVRWNNSPSGSVATSYGYDDTGTVQSAQDARGNPPTSFKYDSSDTYLVEVDKPDTVDSFGVTWHHVTKTSYDFNSGAVLSTDDENSVAHGQAYSVTYQYDPVAGRLSAINYPDGGQRSYTYPSSTETDATVRQNGVTSITTAHILDSLGRAYQTASNGISTEQSYDGNGRLASVTAPHLSTSSQTDGTTYTYYDTLDRPTSIVHPDGTSITATYVGNTATTVDELTSQTSRTYDAFGELTKVVEADPSTGALDLETDYFRDGLGNIICAEQHGNVSGTGCSSSPSSDASSPWRIRRFFYNSLSQVRAASIPEHTSEPSHGPSQNCGTPDGAAQWTDCYSYDPNGNLSASVDNRGVAISYQYDTNNREHVESSPTVTNIYDYDAGVNGIGLLDLPSNDTGGPVNASTVYGYDVMGRIATINMYRMNGTGGLDEGSVSIGYDLAGNIASIAYPDGRVVQNNYDGGDRLSNVVYQSWNGTSIGTTYWSAGSYAPPGELTAAQFGAVQMQAGYNNRQNVTSLLYQNSQQALFSKTYQWDKNASNLILQVDNISSGQRAFGYDKLNRLISATDVSGNSTPSTGSATIDGFERFYYDCSGDGATQSQTTVSKGMQPNAGIGCLKVYDDGEIDVTVGSFLASVGYGQGSTSSTLATQLASLLNAAASPVTATVSGSTITLTSKATGTAANYSLSYTSDAYDGGDDFSVSFSGSTMTGGQNGSPVPGGLNQQYTLDAWGNLSSMGSTGFSQPINNQNQVATYSYDAAGRLLSDGVTNYTYTDENMLATSSDGESYVYDAEGRRAIVTSGSGKVEEFYLGGVPIATHNINTGAWTDLIYAGGERIAEVAGTQTATPVYAITDQGGTEVATADVNGNQMTSLDSAPWGQIIAGTMGSGYFYTGLERDSSGLDHAQMRQYSSVTGRWTVPDPYDGSYDPNDPQRFNRYAYVLNRPLSMSDPSGQDGCAIAVASVGETGIGLGVGAAVCALELFGGGWLDHELFGWLFGKPNFHGSLEPRPSARSVVWTQNDTFGVPYPGLGAAVNQAIGGSFPSQGCEFGPCGGGGFELQQSGDIPNVGVNCRGIETPIRYTNIPWGDIGAQHCDSTVSIGDGWLYSLSAGPIGDRLRGFVTKTKVLPTGSTYFWKGRDGLSLAHCLIGAATASQNSSEAPQYHPVTGPNSNNWLNGIFSICGVNLGIKTHGPHF